MGQKELYAHPKGKSSDPVATKERFRQVLVKEQCILRFFFLKKKKKKKKEEEEEKGNV